MEYAHPESLVSPSWLAKRIGEPALRVVDVRFEIRPGPEGRLEAKAGRTEYDDAHIPGAVFVDLDGRPRPSRHAARDPVARALRGADSCDQEKAVYCFSQ
ncbi:MAG: rhodanese-like domain-containing protein [Proteobacteria bacterium]|nr:rhodanese-like domain-containing protein [Pseudomonadota bacterium]